MAAVETASLPWPPSLPELKRLDDLLRCGICYEFLNTAMVTVCSHNYCSLCIRQYLTYKTQCPACFQETTGQQLRNNRLLDEVIGLFPLLRDKVARNFQRSKGSTIDGYLSKNESSSNSIEHDDHCEKSDPIFDENFEITSPQASTSSRLITKKDKPESIKLEKFPSSPLKSSQNSFFSPSDMDLERLNADVMARDNAELNSSPGAPPGIVGISPGFLHIPGQPGVVSPVEPMTGPGWPLLTQGGPGLHPAFLQAGSGVVVPSSPGTVAIKTLTEPPVPPDNPQSETERQQQSQYEYWLSEQQSLIATQHRYYEKEIAKLRKQRKSLNSLQRTMRSRGQELNEYDASELERVQREAAGTQRCLDQCRKSGRQHTMIIQEYEYKNKNRQSQK